MPDGESRLLASALEVFREQGYAATTLELVAERSKISLPQLQQQYADKDRLLAALLATYSPLPALLAALDDVEGESAEDIIRDAMRKTVKAIQQNEQFLELAAIDLQVNDGNFMANLSMQIMPKALAMLERLKATGQLRPVSDLILARTIVSLLMGFVLSERAMPQIARMALRLFPQRAWLDGMTDLLLYGILEDDAR
jgi:AcrR family transcriptional regulator